MELAEEMLALHRPRYVAANVADPQLNLGMLPIGELANKKAYGSNHVWKVSVCVVNNMLPKSHRRYASKKRETVSSLASSGMSSTCTEQL